MAQIAGFNLRSKDLWLVGGTFCVTLIISVAVFIYAQKLGHERNQSRFEKLAIAIEHDLTSTMKAYGQVLRSSVALLNAKPDTSRQSWRTFVLNLKLKENYPSIQGVSYNAVLRDAAQAQQFEADVRRTDLPDFSIKPEGDRNLYVPILYLEPSTPANNSAIGFDIYSEANRRETVNRAISTGEPNLTAKITLVQEATLNEPSKAQAGLLLITPVTEVSAIDTASGVVTGVVVGVFRMGDLITDILQQSQGVPAEDIEITLYDSVEDDPDAILYEAPTLRSGQAKFTTDAKVNLFGRTWLIESRSTEAFEARVATQNLNYLLVAGVLVSVLITLLFLGQAIRYRDSQIAAQRLESRNARIADLMREVNHRSKNLLSVVQAIARQANTNDPESFADTFSQRLGALSASQDILVKNNWAHVGMDELVRSQFLHLRGLIDERVKITGEDFRLSAANGQTIGMAVHELATNACKFGALSNETGVVDIGWGFPPADGANSQFCMWWRESGGPPVAAPVSTGFGSKVTVFMTEFALSGAVARTFDEGGFEWRLTCPAEVIKNLQYIASNYNEAGEGS